MGKRVGLIIFSLFIIGIFILGPWVTGIYFERKYGSILAFYNLHGLQAKIVNYHRGWLTSDATLSLEVNSPQFAQILTMIGIAPKDIPKSYFIEQRIQHGPIIYHYTNGLPSIFGIAAIQNSLRGSPEVAKFFRLLGTNENFIEINDDFVTFNGNYYKHLKFSALQLMYPESNILINMGGMEGHFWIWPKAKRVSGDLKLQDLFIVDDLTSITIPRATLQFEQHGGVEKFWLGSNTLLVPEMNWREIGGKTLLISGINFYGFAKETAGRLNGCRQFDIDKIDIDDHLIGPFHLQMSVDRLNAAGVMNLIAAYRQIMERGELYESQLKQKMFMMLPDIVSPGSSVTLDKLDIATPHGKFQINGELAWTPDNTALPDDLGELVQAANAQIHLRISKELLDKWIVLAADLPFFNQAELNLQSAYLKSRKDMYFAMRQNAFMIVNMVDDHSLLENDALGLLAMQKAMVSLDIYQKQITKLFLNKNINLMTSYNLSMQYLEVQRPLWILAQQLKKNQEATLEGLQAQLAEWLKAGYIQQEHDDYVVSIMQRQGNLKINEKVIAN